MRGQKSRSLTTTRTNQGLFGEIWLATWSTFRVSGAEEGCFLQRWRSCPWDRFLDTACVAIAYARTPVTSEFGFCQLC